VVIVEDEDVGVTLVVARTGESRDLVDQCRQNRFNRWQLGGLERRQSCLSYIRLHCLQGGDEAGQEARRVVVVFV
jgi:hypothetical protein